MVRVYAGGAKLGGGLAPTLDRGPKRGLSLRQGERDILFGGVRIGFELGLSAKPFSGIISRVSGQNYRMTRNRPAQPTSNPNSNFAIQPLTSQNSSTTHCHTQDTPRLSARQGYVHEAIGSWFPLLILRIPCRAHNRRTAKP